MKILTVLYLAMFALSGFMMYLPGDKYTVAEGHSIAFKSADPSGKFTKITGSVEYSEDNVAATKFNLTIPVNSLSTGNGLMNKKAMTDEWFDQAAYPNITFVSTSVVKNKDGNLSIDGIMTVKGISRNYKIVAGVSRKGGRLIFSGQFPVDRIKFGVGKKSDSVPDIMKVSYTLPVE
jgi:polyisoprenoid-binding protein YceI